MMRYKIRDAMTEQDGISPSFVMPYLASKSTFPPLKPLPTHTSTSPRLSALLWPSSTKDKILLAKFYFVCVIFLQTIGPRITQALVAVVRWLVDCPDWVAAGKLLYCMLDYFLVARGWLQLSQLFCCYGLFAVFRSCCCGFVVVL